MVAEGRVIKQYSHIHISWIIVSPYCAVVAGKSTTLLLLPGWCMITGLVRMPGLQPSCISDLLCEQFISY